MVLLPFDNNASRQLLCRVLGTVRVAAEPGPISEIVALCAGLPLALRITADRAARRPQLSLRDLVFELCAEPSRIDALQVPGDPNSGLRAVFDWSQRTLDEPALRLFRLLGICPGPDMDAYAAANLLAVDLATARRLLEILAGAHLVTEQAAGRFTMHDLLREYASELATAEPGREAAITRLLEYRLHTALTATAMFTPMRRRAPGKHPHSPSTQPPLESSAQALAWLDREREALLADQRHSLAAGRYEYVWRLAHALEPYVRQRGRLDDWLSSHALALHALAELDEPLAEADIRDSLAWADLWRHDLPSAKNQLELALRLRQQAEDLAGQPFTLNALGVALARAGRADEAMAEYGRALGLAQAINNKQAEATVLGSIAGVHAGAGRHGDALELANQAIELFREVGDISGEARMLGNTVTLLRQLGDFKAGETNGVLSVARYQELGNVLGAADSQGKVAWLHAEQHRFTEAIHEYREALALDRQHGQRSAQADLLVELAAVQLRAGDPAGALRGSQEAISLAAARGLCSGKRPFVN